MQDADNRLYQRPRNGSGNIFQRQMGRYEGDTQTFAGKHHHNLPRTAFFRQILGMSAEKSRTGMCIVDDAFV